MSKGKRYRGIVRYLKDKNGYQMTSSQIRTAFGLPSNYKLPYDFTAATYIDGVFVTIAPKTKKGMEKRTFAICPECRLPIEAGHLHQHVQAFHA